MIVQPPYARAWLRQRQTAAAAVAVIEDDELRSLGAEEALALADSLLEATPVDEMAAERRTTSGIVEQQRRFALARR